MKSLDQLLSKYLEQFLEGNLVARELAISLKQTGVGIGPLIDHCTIRTHDVDSRAKQFQD